MANLLSWFGSAAKKVADVASGVERQLNPFDGGATYSNPHPAIAPPQRPNFAQPSISNIPQLAQNVRIPAPSPIQNFGNALVRGAINAGDSALGNVGHLADVINYPINEHIYRNELNAGRITPETYLKLTAESANKAGINQGDKGVTLARKVAGAVAGPTATILTANAGPKILEGANLAQKALAGAELGAKLGGTFGGISTLTQAGPVTLGGTAANIAGGALGGGALGGITPVAAEGISRLLKSPALANEAGKIPLPGSPKKIPISKLTDYEGAPDRKAVEAAKKAIQSGKGVAPLKVEPDSLGNLGVVDGKHRLQAYKELGYKSVPIESPNGVIKQRGLVSSAQESSKLATPTKAEIAGTYAPKTNKQLRGEANALLTEGANIDFKNTKNLDQKVAATIQHALNLDAAGKHAESAALFNNLSEHGTELGRGVQAFSMINKMSPEAISLSAAGKIKAYNRTAARKIPELSGEQQKFLSEAVTKIRSLPEGREQNIAINELQNHINNLIPSSIADKAITVWKAGLLTSLRTHERNLLGNTVMNVSEVAKDLPASAADKLMSLRTGQRSQTTTLQGLREFGSKTTRQQIKDLVSKGYDPSSPISKYDVKHVTWADTPIQQTLKKVTDAVFRPLGAEDKAFYNASFARSLYDQAGAEAINAGRKGDKAFIESLVKNPNENMLKTAVTDANYATFHDKTALSSVATAIKQRLAGQPGLRGEAGKVVGEVLAPFTGVPSSIVSKTFAYSPLGLVKGAVDTGRVLAGNVPQLQRQAAQEVGRGVVGTGLFGLGAYLMGKGLMTGQPKDAAEAKQWELEGKQANSVLIGGKWRSINSIGPQSLVVLAGAKAQEELNKPDGSVGEFAGSLGKDQLNQTFLAGVQGPLQAITDPNRYGKSYVGGLAASAIPNIVKDASKSLDPLQRENNTIQDYVTNSIPLLRNNNLPKRDALGNTLPQEPTGPGAFVDLFNSKTPIHNTVVDELSRLYKADQSATPSTLTKSQTIAGQKVTLTPKELDQLEQATGQPIRQQFDVLMKTPEYKGASDEIKKKALDGIVDKVRSGAKLNIAEGNTGNVVDVNKLTKSAQLTLAKDAFDKSGKNYQVIGDTVLRRGADGTITATPKVKFDYQVGTATLTSQKNAGDLDGWLKTANKQLDSISKQLQDPSIDPLEALTLQNQAESLRKQMDKYQEYAGFTKPKTGRKGNVTAGFKTASSAKAPTIKSISVKSPGTFKAPVTKKLSVNKIASSYVNRKLG